MKLFNKKGFNCNDFEVILTSYDDCDRLVAEIWYLNELIAVIYEEENVRQFTDNMKLLSSAEYKNVYRIATKKLKKILTGR